MPSALRSIVTVLRRRASSEGGFTLIELMIAIGVILVAVVVLTYSATAGFSSIAYSRQRQTANNLANQTMEQLRALPFSYVENGLSAADGLSTDPNITTNQCPTGSTNYCLTMGGITEQIPTGTFSYSNVPPLVPHVSTVSPSSSQSGAGTTYTIRTYVTDYCPNGPTDSTYCTNYVTNIGAYRATVVVSWNNSEAHGGASNKVVVQSVFYNPAGCVSSATHPFQSPCQPFFYGNAALGDGSIQLSGTVTGTLFTGGSLWLPTYDSNLQREQLDLVTGDFQGGGATLQQTGTADENTGQADCQSTASDDPADTNPAWSEAPSTSTPCSASLPQATSPLQVSNGVSLTLNGGSGDTGQTVSTVSSTVAQPCANPNYSASTQTDALPCGSTQGLQQGTLSAVLNLGTLPSNPGSATLASVAPPSCTNAESTPNCGYAFENYDVAPDAVDSAWCPTTNVANGNVGCLHAEAGRTLGTVLLGNYPGSLSSSEQTTLASAGWNFSKGLMTLTGYSDSVKAEIGNGTSSPSASASVSGSLAYYNGSGYSTATLGATQQTITVAGSCFYDPLASGGSLLIAIGANPVAAGATACPSAASQAMSFKVGGASASSSTCAPGPGTCSAGTNSPITGGFYYTVQQAGVVIAQLYVSVNLGQLTAKATYSSG